MMAARGTDRDRSILVVYGTETGTAQDIAEEVGRITERLRFATDVAGLEEVSTVSFAWFGQCLRLSLLE